MHPYPLPPIPVIDVAPGDEPAIASALAEPGLLSLLINSARRTYSPVGVRIADSRSRAWHARSLSPYGDAVRQVDRVLGQRVAFLLNYSYEWGCTSGAADDPRGRGATLLRTLDWPFEGLGRAVVAVRQQGAAGCYASITWPGFAGVLTGLAPGRFAAAINQPPLPLPDWGKAAGWMAARFKVNRSTDLPPSHLLRLAFDTCHSFGEAVDLIRCVPICLPAIFTLAGPRPGDAIVIERTQTGAYEPAHPAAANHWAAAGGLRGRPRNASSLQRRAAMTKLLMGRGDWGLGWLKPPILQPDTRLAVMASPATGRLVAQGWEKHGPATQLLDLVLDD